MKKKFSIITITKNALTDLKRTFESLKNQTEKDFEWIVIDGASSDGTREWLSNVVVKEFDLIWVSERDRGISDAWNKGIEKSNGEQILILNSGDTYDLNMIEIFKGRVSVNTITCAHARLINPNTLSEVGIFKAEPKKLWRGMHLPHNWCSVPISFYKTYGNYPLLKYAMDFSWFHRFYKREGVGKFDCIDLVLGSYYLGGVSDINYIKSFSYNRNILIDNGCRKFLAYALFYIYIVKHALSNLKKCIK